MVSDTLNNNDIVSLSFDVSETKEKNSFRKGICVLSSPE